MVTNTLVILAEDGTKMQALHYKAKEDSKTIVIHVHGMAGNFYENSFIEEIAAECNKMGNDYLVFNNRGHDYIADCERVKDGGVEFFSGGGAYEKFDECIYDIKGVVQWAVSEGYEEIYLEGHSSGANKIIYSFEKLSEVSDFNGRIKGIMLISPCDDIGIFYSEIDEEKRNFSYQLAKKHIQDGEKDELMPQGTFFDYLLSAETFLDSFTEGSSLDMFPYRKGNLKDTKLCKVNVPMLILFGNNGDFVLQDIQDIKRMYKNIVENFEIREIDQADHSYKGQEKVLASTIVEWIGRVHE